MVLAVLEWVRYFTNWPPAPWTYTFIAVIGALVATSRTTRGVRKARRVGLGIKGEKLVAESLDELKARGYRVFHDLEGDGFNIDHVAVGPAGVFVIETKARTKPGGPNAKVTFDGERVLVNGLAPDRDPVSQVRANADRIRRLLRDVTGWSVRVRGVVLFPEWYVVEGPQNPDVWVLNPLRFLGYMRHERSCLSPDQVGRLAAVLSDADRRPLA